MRLGLLLILSFLLLAATVALVGFLYKATGDAVQLEMEELRQSSIAQAVGAAEMRAALQESQLAAQQIITARLQVLVQPDHDTGPLQGLDDSIDDAEDSLDDFEKWLGRTVTAVSAHREMPVRARDSVDSEMQRVDGESILRELEKRYAVYETQMDRFIHLSEYHPTEQVSEFFVDELEPSFEDELSPLIRDFGRFAESNLSADLELMESAHRQANRRNGLVAIAAFLGAVTLGLAITRWILRPLAKLQTAALEVGRGDLQTRVEVKATNEIGVLSRTFNRMVDQLEASTVSRSYLDNIIQSMGEMLIVTDPSGEIRTANRATSDVLGIDPEDLKGLSVNTMLENEPFVELRTGETIFRSSTGESIPVYCSRSDLRADDGELSGIVLVAQDLTERRETAALLRASVAEKEVLLREVHHRVKNNLQIVSSLLNLQNTSAQDSGSTDRVLTESRNRIRSMALIHEQLYKSKDLARIDFSVYARELVHYLARSYDLAAKGVELQLEVDSQPLPVDQAIPCGMIINELVANGVEHAYPEGGGEIRVAFRQQDGQCRLMVADDGRGLPDDLDPSTASTLGLRLVGALAEQLHAEVSFIRDPGTEIRLRFDLPSVAVGGSQT